MFLVFRIVFLRQYPTFNKLQSSNIDLKILSKALENRIKKYLPFLISSNQTAYVEGRSISEDGKPFSDILQVTDLLNLRGSVVTVDIQKAFDSVNHLF